MLSICDFDNISSCIV